MRPLGYPPRQELCNKTAGRLTPELLAVYAPAYAVISAGTTFGHPHAETLARLAGRGIKVYRTDRQGVVVFRSDGEEVTVEAFRRRN